jgi:DNA-binding transcriptional ArsR family regulator
VTDAEDVPRPERPTLDTREVTDPRELRALAHPVRLALLEVLAVEGALTATQAGELIGESPTTCSFHFRQLAKYGFVEEAGGGTGRNRPWKRAHLGMSFPESAQDPETNIALETLTGMFFGRVFERFEHWRRIRRSYPEDWQEACGLDESAMYVTTDELRELTSELRAILARFTGRLADPSLRPPGSRLVEVLAAAYPVAFGQSSKEAAQLTDGPTGAA